MRTPAACASVHNKRLTGGYASVLCSTPFSAISASNSPDWNISVMMSQPADELALQIDPRDGRLLSDEWRAGTDAAWPLPDSHIK
jgi:hypothetical protein